MAVIVIDSFLLLLSGTLSSRSRLVLGGTVHAQRAHSLQQQRCGSTPSLEGTPYPPDDGNFLCTREAKAYTAANYPLPCRAPRDDWKDTMVGRGHKPNTHAASCVESCPPFLYSSFRTSLLTLSINKPFFFFLHSPQSIS